jgi:hypothetical protein
MIADPAGSPAVHGLYGTSEGLLGKLKKSFAFPITASSMNSGYIAWVPEFHDRGAADGEGGNFFGFFSTMSSNPPLNDELTLVYGAGTYVDDSAYRFPDPAAALIRTDVVSDARTLAASLQLTYTGILDQSSGQIVAMDGLTMELLLQGGAAGGPMSVDQIFESCPRQTRLTPNTHETVYHPRVQGGEFHNEEDVLLVVDTTTPKTTKLSGKAERLHAPVIGFAFRGVAVSGFSVDATKIVEWRPESFAGFVMPNKAYHSPDNLHNAVAALDAHGVPRSRVRESQSAYSSIGSGVRDSVWTGAQAGAGQVAAYAGRQAAEGLQGLAARGMEAAGRMAVDGFGAAALGLL